LTACFTLFTANVGLVAISLASSRVFSASSARGTTWFTMPSMRASSAEIGRPV